MAMYVTLHDVLLTWRRNFTIMQHLWYKTTSFMKTSVLLTAWCMRIEGSYVVIFQWYIRRIMTFHQEVTRMSCDFCTFGSFSFTWSLSHSHRTNLIRETSENTIGKLGRDRSAHCLHRTCPTCAQILSSNTASYESPCYSRYHSQTLLASYICIILTQFSLCAWQRKSSSQFDNIILVICNCHLIWLLHLSQLWLATAVSRIQ